jgi:hypothetical protein
MKTKMIFIIILFMATASSHAQPQEEPQSISQYLRQAKLIVLARCISTGSLMRSGDRDPKVQILHVLKGAESNRESQLRIRYEHGMKVGQVYLIRSEREADPQQGYFRVESRVSVVALAPHQNPEVLRKSPVRTVVNTILNSRKFSLDLKIRHLNYEREALERALRNQ